MMEQLQMSENALKILQKRCLEDGETPYQRYMSMATKMASIEDESVRDEFRDIFFDAFANKKMLPNSPAIMNYGKEHRAQQGSGCFVLPIKDDLSDIFDTIRKAALIHKSGGGTGFNFSSLRPNGAIVKTTGKPSSGVIPFLKAYDAGTGAVSQGGVRRGANMGILNITHPDIESFISCKADNSEIQNFNLSVGITEEFMNAVEQNLDWELFFLDKNGNRMKFYPDGDESKALATEKVVKARDLWQKIITYAHKNGEPGIIFIDRLQAGNSVPYVVIDTTNPCGEQPLPPYNSCVLGSIALARCIKADWSGIDWDAFDKIIKTTVRMLDNIVTINEYPEPLIKENHDKQRRIGLGFTGLGDVLIMMGIPYGSPEGREYAEKIMEFMNNRGHYHSYMLGKERGNFPDFEFSKYNLNSEEYGPEAIEFYSKFLPKEELDSLIENGLPGFMRNAGVTTIAPTGSLTTLLDCETYGCEPLFAPAYVRTILNGEELIYVSPLFETVAKREGFYSESLMKKVAKKGSANIPEVPEHWRKVFRNANELSYLEHLMMQSGLQRHCDSGISKTINLPCEATVEDIEQAYRFAFVSGNIKGMTVYRDGARETAPISIGVGGDSDTVVDEVTDLQPEHEHIYPISRPKTAPGTTTQYHTGCGKTYITINYDNKSLIESFAFTGSSGGCEGLTQGLSRAISYILRLSRAFCEEFGLNTKDIMDDVISGLADQLTSVRCGVAMRNKKSEGKSCPDIMGKELINAHRAQFGRQIHVNAPAYCSGDEGGCASCGLCNKQGELGDDENPPIKLPDLKKARNIEKIADSTPLNKCEECGSPMEPSEGCYVCRNCGVSHCG